MPISNVLFGAAGKPVLKGAAKVLSGVTKGTLWAGDKLLKIPEAYGRTLIKHPVATLGTTVAVVGGGKLLKDKFETYATHVDPRYDMTQYNGFFDGVTMRKQAGWLGAAESVGKAIGGVMAVGKGLGMAHDFVSGISGNFAQKKLIEKLMMSDPIVKSADPQQVASYYKTICNMAPNISTDENIVKDLLHNFIKFGRIDLQSLKLLVEAEKTYKDSSTPLWAKVK